MKKFALLFIIVLFCINLFSSTIYAKERWDWIDSSNMQTYFIDFSSIKTNKVDTIPEYPNYNSIESIELWCKVTYNNAGGQQELDLLNAYDTVPDSIYSVIHLRLNFIDQSVDVLNGILYDVNGYVLARYPYRSGYNINLSPRYTQIYYYMLGRISHNDEFKQSKNKFYSLDSYYNKNGKKFFVSVDKTTIQEKSNHIYCYLYTIGTYPDNSLHDLLIQKVDFDLAGNVCNSLSRSISTDNEWVKQDVPWDLSYTLYPDSEIEYIKNSLVKFCKDNHDWVHRYDNGIRDNVV